MKKVTEEDVLRAMESGPVTIEEVATKLSISWAKAQAMLFNLVGQGKIVYERKARMNIFRKKDQGLKVLVPMSRNAKSKSLSQLARELDRFWLDVSAQDIVEAERSHY